MRKARGWLLYLYSGQLATFDLDPLDQSAVPWPFDVGVRIRVAASGIADVRECGLCALLMHVVVPRVVSIIDGSRKPRTDHLRAVMGCGRDRGSWIRFGPGAPWRCFRDPDWPLCSCRSSVGPVGRPRRPVTYFLGKRRLAQAGTSSSGKRGSLQIFISSASRLRGPIDNKGFVQKRIIGPDPSHSNSSVRLLSVLQRAAGDRLMRYKLPMKTLADVCAFRDFRAFAGAQPGGVAHDGRR